MGEDLESARDAATIDSELELMAAVRRACLEHGGPAPSIGVIDRLLDERLSVGEQP